MIPPCDHALVDLTGHVHRCGLELSHQGRHECELVMPVVDEAYGKRRVRARATLAWEMAPEVIDV